MKTNFLLSTAVFFVLIFSGCTEDPPAIPAADYACTTERANTHPDAERFQVFLEAEVADGLPGLSMLIETPEGYWSGAAGQADIPNDIKMEPCHQHLVGSITKVFTAVLIHQLFEEGRLQPTDSIARYLNADLVDKLNNAETATINDLLQHSSGIPEFLDIPFSLAAAEDPKRLFPDSSLVRYARFLDAEFPAGTKVAYSNTNYALLGMIAERITGLRGETLYQNRIFTPLGMNNTFFDQDGGIPAGISRAYYDRYDNGQFTDVTETNGVRASMAGGIVSTPEDMLRFARAVFNDGPILNAASRQALLVNTELPFADPDGFVYGPNDRVMRNLGFGSGLITLETTEGTAIGFNGGYQGRRARMWYWPATDKLIVFFINASGGEANDASRRLFRNSMVEILFD